MFNQRKFRPNLFQRLGMRWCRLMHSAPMWPVNGHYQCRSCGRSYDVPWAGERTAQPVPIWIRPEPRVARRAA